MRVALQANTLWRFRKTKIMDSSELLLYAITDRGQLGENEPLSEAVKAALEGGITLLQLREKNLSDEEFLQSAIEISNVCKSYGIKLIINDNVEICKKCGADGVHLGQGDMDIKEARKILGNNKIIGITAKTVEQAQKAQSEGADYIGSGAIFGTSTKSDAMKMDMETLKAITSSVAIPVVAIGGIDEGNVEKLCGCGLSGVAVVSGIFSKEDKKAATKQLLQKVKKIV